MNLMWVKERRREGETGFDDGLRDDNESKSELAG
jgi:hypothetical protein